MSESGGFPATLGWAAAADQVAGVIDDLAAGHRRPLMSAVQATAVLRRTGAEPLPRADEIRALCAAALRSPDPVLATAFDDALVQAAAGAADRRLSPADALGFRAALTENTASALEALRGGLQARADAEAASVPDAGTALTSAASPVSPPPAGRGPEHGPGSPPARPRSSGGSTGSDPSAVR